MTTVDSRGALCPVPIIELAKAAAGRAAGDELTLLADDPAAAVDVAAWCRMRGHLLVSRAEDARGGASYVVRLGSAGQ